MEKNIYFYSGIVFVDGCAARTFFSTWNYIPEEDGNKHELMMRIIKHVQEGDNETVVLTALNKL